MKKLGKEGLSEDMQRDSELEIQNLTNNYSVKVDAILKDKESDIMTV